MRCGKRTRQIRHTVLLLLNEAGNSFQYFSNSNTLKVRYYYYCLTRYATQIPNHW